MDKFEIFGPKKLFGNVKISGAKNASLPIIAAGILTDETLELENVPNLSDVKTMIMLLKSLGIQSIQSNENSLSLSGESIANTTADYEIVRKMRASILVLGPLIARFDYVKISLPGGCVLGTRPVDAHLLGLKQMGAEIEIENGYIIAKKTGKLTGAVIKMPIVSVTGTENLIMAATLSTGETTIENAAIEPEVTDLVNCLIKMGAEIYGGGTSSLKIVGAQKLHGANYKIISDRIEAGTYACIALATDGEITLENVNVSHLDSLLIKLKNAGALISINLGNEINSDTIKIKRQNKKIFGTNVTTGPFPNFPTDMQAQFMALMTIAEGTSTIKETLFENRFMHVAELRRMGGIIEVSGNVASVEGEKFLRGAEVMATDLRASASLIIAALAAEGKSTINRIYHLDRGYENFEKKLRNCGANILRIK